jgi:hypothetical protein
MNATHVSDIEVKRKRLNFNKYLQKHLVGLTGVVFKMKLRFDE